MTRRRAVGTGLAMVGAGCAVPALLGLAGGRFARADFLNQFAPFWFAAGVPAAIAALLLLRRRGRHAAFLILAILAASGAVTLAPELGARFRASADPGPPDLRLIQFNIFKDNRAPDRTARWSAAQDADVVTIDEGMTEGVVLTALRRLYPYQYSCLVDRYCSTTILTRRPPLAVERLARGDPDNAKGLSAVAVTLMARGGPVTVVAVHLVRPWPFGDQRAALAQLAADLRRYPPARLIVAGDFNMTPWAFGMAQIERAVGVPRVTRALPSWPTASSDVLRSPVPLLPIDHVFVGRGLGLVSLRRGPAVGSDHYPLVVSLRTDGG